MRNSPAGREPKLKPKPKPELEPLLSNSLSVNVASGRVLLLLLLLLCCDLKSELLTEDVSAWNSSSEARKRQPRSRRSETRKRLESRWRIKQTTTQKTNKRVNFAEKLAYLTST